MSKIAWLFPGQGSQYVGMGKKLIEQYEIAKAAFWEANEVLGFDLIGLCRAGDFQELTLTANAQPAILATSVAAYRVFEQEYGLQPQFAAGHSLGEFSALTAAGAIRYADALQLVRKRGLFMQESVAQGDGAMAAIGNIASAAVQEACEKASNEQQQVVISNFNSPEQVVISGHQPAVQRAADWLTERGAKVTMLSVSAPFHSPLMQTAAEKLQRELEQVTYGELKFPVLSNVTGLPYTSEVEIVRRLTEQMTAPVQWQASLAYLVEQGVTTAIELGPKTVLRNMTGKNTNQVHAYSFDNEDDQKNLVVAFKRQIAEHKRPKPTVVEKCIAIAVCTKNNNWDDEEYRKGVVEPYRALQKMQAELEETGTLPSLEQKRQAMQCLQTIFTTKKTPLAEQQERFAEIKSQTGETELFAELVLS